MTDERVGSGHRRALLVAALAAGASCVIAIMTVDGPLAVGLRSLAPEARRGIQSAVGVCELLFAFGISPYLYGGLLVGAGVVAFRATKSRLESG